MEGVRLRLQSLVYQRSPRKFTSSAFTCSACVHGTLCGPPGSSTNLTFLIIFACRRDVASGGRMRSASPCRMSVDTGQQANGGRAIANVPVIAEYVLTDELPARNVVVIEVVEEVDEVSGSI